MKIDQPGAHIDHMLRQTRWHHVQLSSMADTKANFLLTLSSVVITLAVPHILNPMFQWSLSVLVGFCLVTVALAAYTVMPKVSFGAAAPIEPELRSPHFNLLFFGDFVQLPYDQFESEMEQVINDPSRVYQIQIKELYTLGVYLAAKKFRVLKYAYISFTLGLFASGLTLAIALFQQ
jgi:hypothetical protein